MVWYTPKTDWVATDYVNVADYNRWKNNLNYLQTLCLELYQVAQTELGQDKSVTDIPYADMLNAIETALTRVNQASYRFNIGSQKSFSANNTFIDYNEINRIESASLRIYRALVSQKSIERHLGFRLGNTKMFDVPRTSVVLDEEIEYRLPYRCGAPKGEYTDEFTS